MTTGSVVCGFSSLCLAAGKEDMPTWDDQGTEVYARIQWRGVGTASVIPKGFKKDPL